MAKNKFVKNVEKRLGAAMDLLIRLRILFVDVVYMLPESLTCLILRIGLLLTLVASALFFAWQYLPWRTVFTQTCVAFITFVISLYVPVSEFRQGGKEFLAFIVSLAFLCMIFLPNWLPFWLTPKLGNQQKLKKILRRVIWGMFILQIIIGG